MIAVIQGSGNNMASVQYALARLGAKAIFTTDPKIITRATHVILPGVGHAAPAMNYLRQLKLDRCIAQLTQPVLGICLGMQLLYEYSEEGETPCLGIIPGKIRRLKAKDNQRVPHMGWNQLNFKKEQDSLAGNLNEKKQVYFVHSYAAPLNEHTLATTTHGEIFTSIVRYRNFYGMQFHPERSSANGEQLLTNFLALE